MDLEFQYATPYFMHHATVFFIHHTRFKIQKLMFINHTLQKSKIMDAAKVFLILFFKSTFLLFTANSQSSFSFNERRSEADKKPIEKQTID